MSQPDKCKWCGSAIATDILYTLRFKCGTTKEGGKQYQSERCQITCLARERDALREQLKAADELAAVVEDMQWPLIHSRYERIKAALAAARQAQGARRRGKGV